MQSEMLSVLMLLALVVGVVVVGLGLVGLHNERVVPGALVLLAGLLLTGWAGWALWGDLLHTALAQWVIIAQGFCARFSFLMAALVVAGLVLTALGGYGVRNLRGGGVVVLLLGLTTTLWAGSSLHGRFYQTQTDQQMAQTKLELRRAQDQREQVEAQLTEFSRQEAKLLQELRPLVPAGQTLASVWTTVPEAKQRVEQLTMLHRWTRKLMAAKIDLENSEHDLTYTLFILKNQQHLVKIDQADVSSATAKAVLTEVKQSALTPAAGTVSIPVSAEEVKAVETGLRQ